MPVATPSEARSAAVALLAALDAEHEALLGSDPDLIAAAAQRKHAAMDRLVQTMPADEDTSAIEHPLRMTLASCERQNRINGRVLAERQRVAQGALAILLGTSDSATYERTGAHPDRAGVQLKLTV